MLSASKEHFKNLKELHASLPLFFQPWWLDTVCKQWNVALLEENKQIKAVFPFQVEKKMGLTLLRNPLLSPYLGPLFLENTDKADCWSFEEQALTTLLGQFPKWDYFQMETLPEFQNFQALHQMGFINHSRLTYYIDLKQPEETLFSNIHSRRRNYIRKAAAQLSVSVDKAPDLDLFYKWHQQAFARKKQFYPYSAAFLKKIVSEAEQHEASLFQTARNAQNEPVAMLWTPFDQQKAYHLLGAYNPKNEVKGAMDLLVWNALKNARAAGKAIYDFEGSMDAGIESFFRKFGGERKQYFSFSQNKSFIWRIKKLLFS